MSANPFQKKTLVQKASESKTTTAVGGLTMITGIVVSLIPGEVRDTCFTAVMGADNPALVGGLLAAGLGLTILGPSLKKS